MNISASALQHPLKQPQDIMKVTHYPTPPSMPAAAAAAAAMHAGAQHQHIAQTQERAGNHLDASSPLTVSPNSSRSMSPVGTLRAWLVMHVPGVRFGKLLLSGRYTTHRHAAFCYSMLACYMQCGTCSCVACPTIYAPSSHPAFGYNSQSVTALEMLKFSGGQKVVD